MSKSHKEFWTACENICGGKESQCFCHVRLHKLHAGLQFDGFPRLQGRKEYEWFGSVNIVYGDMRKIELPEQVDIIVSELLGSFGDNELSPECLDGAMRFLNR